MKNLLLLIFMVIFLYSCDYTDKDKEIEIGHIYNYSFDNNIKISSVEEAMDYVYNNIEYKYDSEIYGINDYWQLPEQTYHLKTGDCEDFNILLMYLLETKIDIRTELVYMKITSSLYNSVNYHVITYLPEYSIYIEPELNEVLDNPTQSLFSLQTKEILYKIPYDEVIWMTYYYHDNVGKYR